MEKIIECPYTGCKCKSYVNNFCSIYVHIYMYTQAYRMITFVILSTLFQLLFNIGVRSVWMEGGYKVRHNRNVNLMVMNHLRKKQYLQRMKIQFYVSTFCTLYVHIYMYMYPYRLITFIILSTLIRSRQCLSNIAGAMYMYVYCGLLFLLPCCYSQQCSAVLLKNCCF